MYSVQLFLKAGDKRRLWNFSNMLLAGSIPSANLQHLTSEHTRNDNNFFDDLIPIVNNVMPNAINSGFVLSKRYGFGRRERDEEIMLNIYRYSNTPIGINNISQNDATHSAKNNILMPSIFN